MCSYHCNARRSRVNKLLQAKNSTLFLAMSNHRDVVKHLIQSLPDFDELHTCENGHEPDLVVGMLARFVSIGM